MDAEFLTEVLALLEDIGYPVGGGDPHALRFCARSVEREIMNACNLPEVPKGLRETAVALTISEFLRMKLADGGVSAEALHFEPVLKTIQEGDTRIDYAADSVNSGEQRMQLFFNACERRRGQFAAYRKLKW